MPQLRERINPRTVCWIPASLTLERLNDLGKLVILEKILEGRRFDSHAEHLNPDDRRRALGTLTNQRSSLTGKPATGPLRRRDKALNALRQLIDEVHSGRFPGLYLLITGTLAFYDGPQGVQRLAPLAQRLAVDFTADPRFDNPRAVQIRLPGFTHGSLVELGTRVRDLYAVSATGAGADRIAGLVDDEFVAQFDGAVAGGLGGRVGVAPRLFLKKLIDVLDRVDQVPDFRPREHYPLTLNDTELTDVERNAARADDIALDNC